METVVGFAVGFLVGTKEGKDGLARIVESWSAIKEAAPVRNAIGSAIGLAWPIAKDLTKSFST